MKMFAMLLIGLFFTMTSFAGVGGYNGTTNLGLFANVKCSTGTTCTKSGDKLQIAAVASPAAFVAATATTLTASQCGTTFYNTGAVVVKLPKSSASLLNCIFHFVTMNASNFDINPDDADRILILTDATGDAIRNATIGNNITLKAVSATQWTQTSGVGTYTDVN